MTGLVVKSTGSWYAVLVEGEKLQARLRGKLKLVDKKITNPVAVGDTVEMEELNGDFIIKEVLPRKNYVTRISTRKKGHTHLLASNVDQAVLIASYRMPKTSLGFIDRFFVTLETFRIPGFLIINKADLYTEEEISQLAHTLGMYEAIGYRGVITSFLEGDLSEIKGWLNGKTTLLSGHSGTGKSTLINQLVPNARQDLGEVSSFANKGTHTTTFAEMFSADRNSHIIDTPGIKELGLVDIGEEELSHYFPEMRALLGMSKFHNCRHVNEPGCVIQEAVQDGEISPSRFRSYLSMMENDDNRH